MRTTALAVIGIGCVVGGCLWDPNLDKRPARLQLGLNSRRVSAEVPKQEAALGGYAARTTGGQTTTPSDTDAFASTGVTGSAQFTMGYAHHLYMGGEIEAGPMGKQGAYFGGAYGVVGADAASNAGSLSVELAAGRRWLRPDVDSDDVASFALEPRVRGQLLLGPQVTVGGVIGANAVPGETGWMAGIYVGLYSHEQNASK